MRPEPSTSTSGSSGTTGAAAGCGSAGGEYEDGEADVKDCEALRGDPTGEPNLGVKSPSADTGEPHLVVSAVSHLDLGVKSPLFCGGADTVETTLSYGSVGVGDGSSNDWATSYGSVGVGDAGITGIAGCASGTSAGTSAGCTAAAACGPTMASATARN